MRLYILPTLLLGYVVAGPLCANSGAADTQSMTRPIITDTKTFILDYCIDCHDSDQKTGGVDLDVETIDWSKKENRDLWQRVLEMSEQQLMPPPEMSQPTDKQRETVIAWLDDLLRKHTPIGGTLPRRLGKAEYQATIRSLFSMPDYQLPIGFPKDTIFHGFNNVGEGLVLSGPLMEAYTKIAADIADTLYGPKKTNTKSSVRIATPDDMVISFAASLVKDGAIRLASRSKTIMRSCTWPSRMEITTSGTYRITVSASTFKPNSKEAMILEIWARVLATSDEVDINTFRFLKEISVTSETSNSVMFEADIYEGETVLFRWRNAEMDHDHAVLAEQMRGWFKKDKRFLAAWQKAVFPNGIAKKPDLGRLRGQNGWKIVKGHWQDPGLDTSEATMETPLTHKLLEAFDSVQGMWNLADALCHYYFEHGPSLEIHGVTVEGPLVVVDGPKEKRRTAIQYHVAGVFKEGLSDEAFARKMLYHFLPRAFRRPVDPSTIDTYLAIAKDHWHAGHSFEQGMHLLVRNILISPRFLYRSISETKDDGVLDDHDLATRLSYFLMQGPPDVRLIDLAAQGRLSESRVLRREALRLMPNQPKDAFVESFTGQWLDTNLLDEIMPDPKFKFSPYYIDIAHNEVTHCFAEMIRDNHPMTDFIDPDFTYTSPLFAKRIYSLKLDAHDTETKEEQRILRRITLPRGHRSGGLLGQSAIMMATANGVDTQPVLRGAWVLENILGSPTPEPPNDVPALTPDIRGTTTPREMLAAHTKDVACAVCHNRIDPIGFVLENYDPVGRWRDTWPKGGGKIDSTGVLPDGTQLKDVVNFKHWLVGNIDLFSQCLGEKLMTYATGRVPNYAEQKEIKKIVKANHKNGNGFRDLILAIIASETFRTK